MKICLKCENRYTASNWRCPLCGSDPVQTNGVTSFAPDSDEIDDGFNPDYYDKFFRLEETHFWFQHRNEIVLWAYEKFFPDSRSFFELGCGTGFVLSAIEKKFPEVKIYGGEIHTKGLSFAQRRVTKAAFFQLDARNIPFEEEFDVIGAFDMLEHFQEDEGAIRQIYKATKTGGGILLTVPQHPFLWSSFDEFFHHVRRYTSKELKSKIEGAGFKIVWISSFMSLPLPFLIASRSFKRHSNKNYNGFDEFQKSLAYNRLMRKILNLEGLMIRKAQMRLPVGSSLFVVAKK